MPNRLTDTTPTKTKQKCISAVCTNYAHQGKFVGGLCFPCYQFITTGQKSGSMLENLFDNKEATENVSEEEVCLKHMKAIYKSLHEEKQHLEEKISNLRQRLNDVNTKKEYVADAINYVLNDDNEL